MYASGITKDTTDDQLMASVRLDKHALNIATDGDNVDKHDAERLAKLVNNIATEEGRLAARYALRNALAGGADEDAVRRHLMSLVLVPADDTYSGRANDVRRAKADGLRDEVATLLRALRLA